MRKLLVILLISALPATVMALEYNIGYAAPDWTSAGAFNTWTYDPNVDAAMWLEENYIPPYSPYARSPYETNTATATGLPTASDNVHFEDVTTNRMNMGVAGSYSCNKLYLGDAYWPLNYTSAGWYATTDMRQTAGSMTANTVIYGRDQFPDDAMRGGASMASNSKWNIRGSATNPSLNLGAIKVLNTNTTVTPGYQLTNNCITTEISSSNSVAVNIGDMLLNDTMTYLHVNAGIWSITGDIRSYDGVGTDNLSLLLVGNTTEPGDTTSGGRLHIKWTELLQVIDAGQLWVMSGSWGSRKYLKDWGNSTGGTVELVTRANMNTKLDYHDLGYNWVEVHRYVTGATPEPATLLLLGLGGLFIRRRRA